MTLLKDNNYKEINVALLSLEADIKNKTGFDTSVIDKQLAEINSRIDKINAGGSNNSSAVINNIREEIEDINSKLKGNSVRIESIEQKLSDIFSAENKVTDFNTTTDSGIYYWAADTANRPTDYGVLLVNKYYNGGDSTTGLWINQVAYGTDNRIYFRQNINSGNWTEWKAVAFTTDTHLTLNGDNGISSGYGNAPLTIGFPSGTNDGKSLCFDRNSMQARTNDETSVMYINFYGGMVIVNEQSKSDGGLKVKNKMVIPIGAPSSLEDGCIWIER